METKTNTGSEMSGYSGNIACTAIPQPPVPCDDVYNLGAMTAGVNYNNAIAGRILALAKGCDQILDFGAGQGAMANRFDKSVVCVEPDKNSALLIKPQHSVLESIGGLKKGSFDFIYSVNVIEHIEKDRLLLQQLTSLLKPSGRLCLFVPARQELYSAMDQRVGHLRRYSRGQLVRLVANAGCRVDSCRYFDSIGYLASIGLKLFGRNGWDGSLSARSVGFYDRMFFPLSSFLDIVLQWFIGKNLILTGTKV